MALGIYGAYFASTGTIAAIVLPVASVLVLYGFFTRTRSPRARSWSLGLMLLSSIFVWLFLGLSLLLCYAFADAYEYELGAAVRTVFGGALLVAIGAGFPLSLLIRKLSPKIVLSKVKGLSAPKPEIEDSFDALRNLMGIPGAELRMSKAKIPISFAVETDKLIVVMSESLLSLLRKDEVEAVMAHELAHMKNCDTTLKAMVTAYKTALPHDPIIRLVEAAFHREREMVADETAARATKKPLSLALALLKIYEAFPKSNLRSYGTLSILGAGSTLMSRHPPIRNRINQLIHLAETYH